MFLNPDWKLIFLDLLSIDNNNNNNNTFISPSTHTDADKVKKINNISVSTQLSLELK